METEDGETTIILETLLILSFLLILLAKSGQIITRTAIRISEHFGITEAAIGFIMMATFTSFPELMIASTAASMNEGGISIGNVIGANLSDICLVLGATALFSTISMKREEIFDNAEILLLVSLLPLIFLIRDKIAFWEGLILLSVFFLYCVFVVREKFSFKLRGKNIPFLHWMKTNVFMWGGMLVLITSAHYVVVYAVKLAGELQVPESLIGVTLISLGTSLPELVTSLTAVLEKRNELAVGEILGSCVTNLTLVLGAAAVINPLVADFTVFTTSIGFLIGANMLLWYFLVKYEKLTKVHGLFFILLYALFLIVELVLV